MSACRLKNRFAPHNMCKNRRNVIIYFLGKLKEKSLLSHTENYDFHPRETGMKAGNLEG